MARSRRNMLIIKYYEADTPMLYTSLSFRRASSSIHLYRRCTGRYGRPSHGSAEAVRKQLPCEGRKYCARLEVQPIIIPESARRNARIGRS